MLCLQSQKINNEEVVFVIVRLFRGEEGHFNSESQSILRPMLAIKSRSGHIMICVRKCCVLPFAGTTMVVAVFLIAHHPRLILGNTKNICVFVGFCFFKQHDVHQFSFVHQTFL